MMRTLFLSMAIAFATSAVAQDPVQELLQSDPQLVRFAGSTENFYSLVVGLTQGRTVRIAAPAEELGFNRVASFAPPVRLSTEQTAAVLEEVQRDLALRGTESPSPEDLSAAGLRQLGTAGQIRVGPQARTLSAEARAYAALPEEIRSLLSGYSPREAMQKVEIARQELIALGTPDAGTDRLRIVLQNMLSGQYGYGTVEGASAGSSSFPPLSPLVPRETAR